MNQPYLGRNFAPPQAPSPVPGYQTQGSLGSRNQGLGYTGYGDPFGYTNNSLLTPWTQDLPDMPDFGGGGGPGAFSYADFGYNFSPVGNISAERVDVPDDFEWGLFEAPTLDETNDPGYAFRLAEAERSIKNNASAQGVRGGDVAKALNEYAQNYASSEYDKVWNRAFNAFQGNFSNQFSIADMNRKYRLQSQMANQDAALRAAMSNQNTQMGNQQMGWQVASGVYDRNRQNAMDAYSTGAASAAAGQAAARDQYNEQMRRYGLAYDIFNANQTNQFNRLYSMAGIGQSAANNMSNAAGAYAANAGNAYMGGANAEAQGYMNTANAYGGAFDAATQGMILASPYNPFQNYNGGRTSEPYLG